MGVSVEEWRAAIGQWSGGRAGKSAISETDIPETSNHSGYRQIRFLVLISLLVIGCVELNPGPDHESSSASHNVDALPKYSRRPGTSSRHGDEYEIKTAAFLFARGLNNAEEFCLASNVDGAGAFDDLVFRYRLRGKDSWTTAFIQLKHKLNTDTILRSTLTKLSGDFSLFKYFSSFYQIKFEVSTSNDLKQFGSFADFEFVIYTNAKMVEESTLTEDKCDKLRILSSGESDKGYMTFDETKDKDFFEFFEELSLYRKFIIELYNRMGTGTLGDKEINEKIETFRKYVHTNSILGSLNSLTSVSRKDFLKLKGNLEKCDFSLAKEFLGKVKIFQSQSKEGSFQTLIVKELRYACKTSNSVASSIYKMYETGFSKWWNESGDVAWLTKNSELWRDVETYFFKGINEISQPEVQEILGCGIRFKRQPIQGMCDAIENNGLLKVFSNSSIRILQKLKIYQALENLGYKNTLFIGLKSLKDRAKEIQKLWPCKWSNALVIDCDTDVSVAETLLCVLRNSVLEEKGPENLETNKVETIENILQNFQQKLILIAPRQFKNLTPEFPKVSGNIYAEYEDTCEMLDLDEESQKVLLLKNVVFQGQKKKLKTLVGTQPVDHIIRRIDSDVISILLSNEHELRVGRKLGELCKYYIPRVLEHHIYLKENILKPKEDDEMIFAVSGLQAEKLRNYLPAGQKVCQFVRNERDRSYSFKNLAHYSQSSHNLKGEIVKTSYETGEKRKPEDIRYVVLGELNPERDFEALKALCGSVHWIHIEDGYFLWRGSNNNIDIIHRYIDYTHCKQYDVKNIIEHKDRTKLLVAEPGMGKSTFLSIMEHEIKDLNPSTWVLRINLNEHTRALEEMELDQDSTQKCKKILWDAAHLPEQDALPLVEEIFLQALEQEGKMVIILDGFDEISPYFSSKIKKLISEIREKTASKLWVSSRTNYLQDLENNMAILPVTLRPLTSENQIKFFEEYWRASIKNSKQASLREFAEMLLSLSSKSFIDLDGEFTGIPLQTMMLGEAFLKEAEEYCSSGEFSLKENFNLLALFKKFWEKKCDVYFIEKNSMHSSTTKVKMETASYLEKHMISALITLFSRNEVKQLLGTNTDSSLEQVNVFLRSGHAEQFGIITEIKDGVPQFIHRCLAEYFAAKWFANHFTKCEHFISSILFNKTYEVTRKMFDRMLAEGSDIHSAVLSNNETAIKEILKDKIDVNVLDKGGRTALHLAACYNSPITQTLLSIPGISVSVSDLVLKWTPLRYAKRTKSWMVINILLQNGGNSEDIVFTKRDITDKELGQAALWECARNGYVSLLQFLMKCGINVNAVIDVPHNDHTRYTLLEIASICGQVQVVRSLLDSGADTHKPKAKHRYNTAIHIAASAGSVEVMQLLLERGMSVNLINRKGNTPLHTSALCGNMEATKCLVKRGAGLNKTNRYGTSPLLVAAERNNLHVFRYLTDAGADINYCDAYYGTVLHCAIAHGWDDIIKILLEKGMSVNLTDRKSNTPLHISAEVGNMEATKFLVERGAGLNNTNRGGETPLMVAAKRNNLDVFRYLTDAGADINYCDTYYGTALHWAAACGWVHIIKLLLNRGMSVNLTDRNGNTPLHMSAKLRKMEATKFLVERGAGLNITNRDGETPLMVAAQEKISYVFRYLTNAGADINSCGAYYGTVIHWAAAYGWVDIIKLLLERGISVNVTGRNGNTPLHISAEHGSMEATKFLLERGAGLNNTNRGGETPLMVAAKRNNLDVFRYLTEMGADINYCDAYYGTVLHWAATYGWVHIIKVLLERGMSVNLTDRNGNTPLLISAKHGNMEATKFLVVRGAGLNNTNTEGETPLVVAARRENLDVFRFLTDAGADINCCDAYKGTALHYAILYSWDDIIKLLLERGMSVNVTDRNGNTPLHISAKHGNMEATKFLVVRGAGLNNTNTEGETPLVVAARRENLDVFRFLTDAGADINCCDANKGTALHYAILYSWDDIIKLLLERGISVNVTNRNGNTPLHMSAEVGNMEATKFLVDRGAGLNNTNTDGETPLMVAAKRENSNVFRYLTEAGADINSFGDYYGTVLHWAAVSGCVDIIKLLLERRMSVDLTDRNGNTPLHISAKHGNMEATKFLVARGAGLNNTNRDGETPLMVAARRENLDVFRFLTDAGADINCCDANKGTALHYAILYSWDDIIKLLLERGISVNVTNRNGNTPLHISAKHGNMEATKFLVARGAGLNNTNRDGETPLMVAAKRENSNVFRYLTDAGADINSCGAYYGTVLHCAAASSCVDIIRLLIERGMSVNLTDRDGNTPLHMSARKRNMKATKFLVERGAGLNNTNRDGETPLMVAAKRENSNVFRYLTYAGADINSCCAYYGTVLHCAAASGCVDIIRLLLERRMSVNLTDRNGNTPLHMSAKLRKMEATKFLVERGAGLNITNRDGETPLMVAAQEKISYVFRYLTNAGADINSCGAYYGTVIHWAAAYGWVDIIKLLLQRGISVNVTGRNGNTPLHISAEHGNMEATKFLVERGARLNKTNRGGETPLMVAAKRENLDVCCYLTDAEADTNILKAKKRHLYPTRCLIL